LIRIEFVVKEPPDSPLKYHMYFIYYILKNRISHYRSETPLTKIHVSYGTRRMPSFRLKKVEPHADSTYWCEPVLSVPYKQVREVVEEEEQEVDSRY
jgi:hypothetical protein